MAKRRYETKLLPPDHALADGLLKVGDFGSTLKISGLLMQGEGQSVIILAPNALPISYDSYDDPWGDPKSVLWDFQPSLEEWTSILRQTDDPVVFQRDELGTLKAIVRKVQFQISGGVQWRVFDRDGFQCMYCGRKGGDGCPLTVDHFVPLELGGENSPLNLVSSCRRCNKLKGSIPPEEFCAQKGYDFEGLRDYLKGTCSKVFIAHF